VWGLGGTSRSGPEIWDMRGWSSTQPRSGTKVGKSPVLSACYSDLPLNRKSKNPCFICDRLWLNLPS
jgi:hypothetical protein